MTTIASASQRIRHLGAALGVASAALFTSACASASGLNVAVFERFDQPWAMTFLPDGNLLITEKPGQLQLFTLADKTKTAVQGVPEVEYGGQGGLGDIVLHPDFQQNQLVYLSYAEAGDNGTAGAAVARARLERTAGQAPALADLTVIWRQTPKVSGRGHYGHRIAFSPDGYLFISSGERQKFDPSQDMQQNLGKIIRLHDDGRVPDDNPFADQGGVAAQVWSLGHRNPLGMAFDASGQLWNHEMGPRGGDEFNRVKRGANYGYPIVSNGRHYSGLDIPDHNTRPEFEAPVIWWTPVISPGGLAFYTGDLFKSWRGNALIAGLSAGALIRIDMTEGNIREVERYDMRRRIREVEQGPDDAVWLLEDGGNGRLLKLTPPN